MGQKEDTKGEADGARVEDLTCLHYIQAAKYPLDI